MPRALWPCRSQLTALLYTDTLHELRSTFVPVCHSYGLPYRPRVLRLHEVVRAGRWSQRRDPYLVESSVPGIFACGHVRLRSVKRVAAAVGEGGMVIALVRQFLSQRQ